MARFSVRQELKNQSYAIFCDEIHKKTKGMFVFWCALLFPVITPKKTSVLQVSGTRND